MTGEEKSGLYVDLLHHFEALWEERDKRLTERWEAQESAINRRAESLELRLNHLNELRAGVITRVEYEEKHKDVERRIGVNELRFGSVVSREEYDQKHLELDRRLANEEQWRANLTGRMVVFAVIATLLIGVVAALITHLAGA